MIRLLSVPYHLGRRGVGMGSGPDRLLGGAVRALSAAGHDVGVDEVALPVPFEHEIGAQFALQRVLADHVHRARAAGEFPFVLGGNCSSVLGAVAGLGLRCGVVWFDAHGDTNTPETTDSGFLDGMPVAVLTGRCWTTLASSIPGFVPLADDHVVLAGIRAIDDAEQVLLDSSAIAQVPAGELANEAGFATIAAELDRRVTGVHVHVDLDVIDTGDGYANEFAADGGPTLDVLDTALRIIGDRCRIDSISVTSYNPGVDEGGRALAAGMRLLGTLAELAGP